MWELLFKGPEKSVPVDKFALEFINSRFFLKNILPALGTYH